MKIDIDTLLSRLLQFGKDTSIQIFTDGSAKITDVQTDTTLMLFDNSESWVEKFLEPLVDQQQEIIVNTKNPRVVININF